MNNFKKTCSFIGHRKIDISENEIKQLTKVIENLIVKNNVKEFLFGSRSAFNDLCHQIVSKLKEKYSDLKRIVYTCKSETCILENQKEEWQKRYNNLNLKINVLAFEKERNFKDKFVAGKSSYIKRNQAMIDDSDFCVMYYRKNYLPQNRTNSGTDIAYNYAVKRTKQIINIESIKWN